MSRIQFVRGLPQGLHRICSCSSPYSLQLYSFCNRKTAEIEDNQADAAPDRRQAGGTLSLMIT